MNLRRLNLFAVWCVVACAAGALAWRHLALLPRYLPVTLAEVHDANHLVGQRVSVEGQLLAHERRRRLLRDAEDRWMDRAVEVRSAGAPLPRVDYADVVVNGTLRRSIGHDGRRVYWLEAEAVAPPGAPITCPRGPDQARMAEAVLCVATVLPAGAWAWVAGRRASRRRSEGLRGRRRYLGLCPGCGYDLRGSRGRCPECGEGSAGQ